jgi:molybdopterin converting factor subunit 1
VKLFARLRDLTRTAELVRHLEDGATVGSLWHQLATEYPQIASYERSISCAVNADYARMDRTLVDGDEVAFLPPVSGGSGLTVFTSRESHVRQTHRT